MKIGQMIKRAREEAGMSQAQLACRVGIKQPSIAAIESGETTRSKYIYDIAAILGLPLKDVREKTTLKTAEYKFPVESFKNKPNAVVAGDVAMNSTIPVYGHAMGGKHGEFVLNGNKLADILAPPSLTNVKNAYAVYAVGDSMEPWCEAGWVAYIHPSLPVRRGDYVVAQITAENACDGDPPLAYLKRFVSMDGRFIRLEQFNPKATIEFPRNRVISVHAVIMTGQKV